MEKLELKEVLHLYLGCEVQIKVKEQTRKGFPMKNLKGRLQEYDLYTPEWCGILMENQADPTHYLTLEIKNVKPILRPLSDMTSAEKNELMALSAHSPDNILPDIFIGNAMQWYHSRRSVEVTVYLLKRAFDLFGLIESGQAVKAEGGSDK